MRTSKFQKKVRENRKILRLAGYAPATIHTWEYGTRVPYWKTAVKLAPVLGLEIEEVPYYRVERNEP